MFIERTVLRVHAVCDLRAWGIPSSGVGGSRAPSYAQAVRRPGIRKVCEIGFNAGHAQGPGTATPPPRPHRPPVPAALGVLLYVAFCFADTAAGAGVFRNSPTKINGTSTRHS